MRRRNPDALHVRVGKAELTVPASMMSELLILLAIVSPVLVVYLLTHSL